MFFAFLDILEETQFWKKTLVIRSPWTLTIDL